MQLRTLPGRLYPSNLPIITVPSTSASLAIERKFPAETERLSEIIANEFQRSPESPDDIINPGGKIPGFNGNYLYVTQVLDEEGNLDFGPSYVPGAAYGLEVMQGKVSHSLARQHQQHIVNTPSSDFRALGGYLAVFFGDSKDNFHVLLEHRSSQSFLSPNCFNCPGAAIPADLTDEGLLVTEPYQGLVNKVAKKTGLAIDRQQITYVGLLDDEANCIQLLTGYVVLDEAQLESSNRIQRISLSDDVSSLSEETRWYALPARELPGFVKKTDSVSENWLLAGLSSLFYSACHRSTQVDVFRDKLSSLDSLRDESPFTVTVGVSPRKSALHQELSSLHGELRASYRRNPVEVPSLVEQYGITL